MEAIKFSPAEAEQFVETAYSAAKEAMLKKFPETAPRLLEMLMK